MSLEVSPPIPLLPLLQAFLSSPQSHSPVLSSSNTCLYKFPKFKYTNKKRNSRKRNSNEPINNNTRNIKMASSIVLRRASTSGIFTKVLRPFSVTRSFNTGTEVSNVADTDRSVDVERRSDRSVSRRRDNFPGLFSDFDPFSPPRSLNQMLNLMDQFMDNPFLYRGLGSPARRGWDVREDDNNLLMKMDMPGLRKDDVKISVEQNTLIIKGESAEKESEDAGDDENSGRRYSSRVDLPPNSYKFDEIKAEMKNGVLKIVVPKVKEDEKKDVVFHVNVE